MKRKKSNSFFVTSLILAFNFSCAQILVSQELESFIIPDTLFPKNAASCGISHDYIKSLKVGDVTNIPKTAPTSFPSYAVINCGKFDIYYEDLISENPEVGFADQINGQARRNTLCAVLTYIQSVFDFSNIPSNNPIRLHVNESFAPAVNPAPSDAEYLAFAGSTYNLASSQITNGFVFDWTVFSDNIADQGVCLPDATAPATNIFSECITVDESNIFSIANFEYATDPLFGPNCFSTTVLLDICDEAVGSYSNACPQLVSYPCPQCIVALGQQFDFTPPGLERNKIKGELIRRLAQEGDVQQLVNILTSEALPEDKKIIIPTRIKRKEYLEAREVLDSLEQITFEDQKFVELFDVLITLGETERELDELTASELSIIEGVAYSGTEVAVQAEAVLAELNKTRYIRFPQGFPTNTAMMMVTNESETTTTTFMEQINVSVYPNPSEGDVIVKFAEAKNASGYLIDAMGKIVKNFTFIETESVYEIKGLARGLYTLGIYYTDGTSESKRILMK